MKTYLLKTLVVLSLILLPNPYLMACHHDGKGHGHDHQGDKMFEHLDLTEEQQTKIKAIKESHRDAKIKIKEQVRAAKKMLKEAKHAEPFNEAAVRKAYQAMSKHKEEMIVHRAKMMSEIRPILTPEQKTKLKEHQEKRSKHYCPRAK